MGASNSKTVEAAVLDKYTTTAYYLSRGASGNVYGPIPWQGSQLAIKQVTFAEGKVTDEFRKRIEAKKDIWASFESKYLMRIHLVDLTRLPKVMFIVMDYAAGGSLNKTLRSFGSGYKLPIAVVANWAKHIAEGMLYLHEKDIVHRDLKSSNILLMEPFDVRNHPNLSTLKIADFDEIKEHDHTATMSTMVGTCAYMAPEVIKDQRFSKASDVWSFGVVIWEMLSGDIPHKGLEQNAIMYQSINGRLDNLPLEPSFPEGFKLLLNKCWETTHTVRISFEDISSILQRIIGLTNMHESDPVSIETIRTKAAEDGSKFIRGFTILDGELFVMSALSSQIEVYDSMKLSLIRRIKFKELHDPFDIASCSRNNCLYILEWKDSSELAEILRVDPSGKLIIKWLTEGGYKSVVSVTYESNVILVLQLKNNLNEYSPDGELIREINLSDVTLGIRLPLHAIKLTNGHFVVSHGFAYDDLHRVCLVNAGGKLMKSFGGERGSSIGQMNCPVYLSVDGNGFVLVADQWNHRVLLLDSNLEFKREFLTKGKHGLEYPQRILLDESTSRVFLAEWGASGLVKSFKF